MNPPDPQLVKRITALVVEALRREGASEPVTYREPSADSPAVTGYGGSVQVRPPAGLCTATEHARAGAFKENLSSAERKSVSGNYQEEGTSAAPQAMITPGAIPESGSVLTGIVTARQLEDARAAAAGRAVLLAENARPTPLARDWMREHPAAVKQVSLTARSGSAQVMLPWLWWAEGYCNAVQRITGRFRGQLHPSSAARTEAGLMEVVADIQAGVASRRLAGALLFVKQAPLGVYLASRQPALRAASATSGPALEAAFRQLGANVLVLEYPRLPAERMEPLVERFIARTPVVPAHLRRVLGQG